MKSRKFRCSEFNRVQTRLSGLTSLCCLLPNAIFPLDQIAAEKRKLNAAIATGDFSVCGSCPNIYETNDIGCSDVLTMDIFTNTVCPGRCFYCAYTQPGGLRENTVDAQVPAVAQNVFISEDLVELLDRFVTSPGGATLQSVSLSGGDSAFFPDFVRLVDRLTSHGIRVCYLSFGVLPKETEDYVVRKVVEGSLALSVSADAVTSEMWSRIKKRPESDWAKVVSLVQRATQARKGEGVYVKFILNRMNLEEGGRFVEFWYRHGVRNFAISGMHPSTPAAAAAICSVDEASHACSDLLSNFHSIELKRQERLYLEALDGLEKYFPTLPLLRSSNSRLDRISSCCRAIINRSGILWTVYDVLPAGFQMLLRKSKTVRKIGQMLLVRK